MITLTNLIENSESVIRTDPMQDRTNGFFVACFVKSIECEMEPVATISSSKRSHDDIEGLATHDQPQSSKRKKRRKKASSVIIN